jgi:holin-like protein
MRCQFQAILCGQKTPTLLDKTGGREVWRAGYPVGMIPALTTLLVFQLIGEALVRALSLPIPGPVVGMALLLLTLVARPSLQHAIKPTTQTLLQHLSLLFVPAGVGVILHLQRLGDEALAIGVALVVSTLVGLASAALTMAWLMKRVAPLPPPPSLPADGSAP